MSEHLSSVIRNRLYARARFRHLQAVVYIAELGSVRKAAEAMNLAQPTLSHVLADLEALLEAPLFARHGRGLRATPFLEQLLPLIRRILHAVDSAAEQAATLITQAHSVVRLAASGAAVTSVLAKALPAFARAHPQILVQVQEGDPQRLNALVALGDVDLVLCHAPEVVPEGWTFRAQQQDRFAVVAGPSHPLRTGRRITIDRLARETWMAMPTDTQSNRVFDDLFKDSSARPALRLISGRVPGLLWGALASERLLALVPVMIVLGLLVVAMAPMLWLTAPSSMASAPVAVDGSRVSDLLGDETPEHRAI